MNKTIILLCVIVLYSISWASSEYFGTHEQLNTKATLTTNQTNLTNPKEPLTRLDRVLMIPDWTTDSIGLFDPYDGTFLRYLCKAPTASSPKNAIKGPDGNIYLADQVTDAVTIFDTAGNFIDVYADASDGLDNIRGIDFRDNHLFVCNSPSANKSVKEFSGRHIFFRDFITYTGIDPFDIHFLPDGRCLLADIGTADKVALHDTNGTFIQTVITTTFPEQIQTDPVLPGAYLTASFSSNQIIDYDLNGSIYRTFSLGGARGVYRLGNGNLLATYSTSVIEMDSLTGATIQVEKTGSFQYIELYSSSGVGIQEWQGIQLRSINIDKIQPNPFKNLTTIRYNLNISGKINIKIYNCLGGEIKTLINHHQTPGNYSVIWDGKDNNGFKVPDGIYICNIRNADEIHSSKLMFIK